MAERHRRSRSRPCRDGCGGRIRRRAGCRSSTSISSVPLAPQISSRAISSSRQLFDISPGQVCSLRDEQLTSRMQGGCVRIVMLGAAPASIGFAAPRSSRPPARSRDRRSPGPALRVSGLLRRVGVAVPGSAGDPVEFAPSADRTRDPGTGDRKRLRNSASSSLRRRHALAGLGSLGHAKRNGRVNLLFPGEGRGSGRRKPDRREGVALAPPVCEAAGMTYNDSFQDRIANAAKAREKALEKLRAKACRSIRRSSPSASSGKRSAMPATAEKAAAKKAERDAKAAAKAAVRATADRGRAQGRARRQIRRPQGPQIGPLTVKVRELLATAQGAGRRGVAPVPPRPRFHDRARPQRADEQPHERVGRGAGDADHARGCRTAPTRAC